MAPEVQESHRLDMENGQRVTVLSYEDGSLRFRVNGIAPAKVTEAFLTGDSRGSVILKVERDTLPAEDGGSGNLAGVAQQVEAWKARLDESVGEDLLAEGFSLLRSLRGVMRRAPSARVREKARLLSVEVEGVLIEEDKPAADR